MIFKSLIRSLIDPFAILWLLLLVVLVLWFFKKERWLRWLMPITIAWFFLISTPLISTLLLNSLEKQYEPIDIETFPNKDAEYYIIVLGGGHSYDSGLPANALLSREALGRLSEGIRLHQKLPNSKLVLSGFTAQKGRITQAEMLQQAAVLMGVEEETTIIQNDPANTYEEAKDYAAKYGNTYPVILVTSAYHMPRAVRLFKMFNIDTKVSPTNYRLKGSRKRRRVGLPSTKNVENLSLAMSEYAAMAWYL